MTLNQTYEQEIRIPVTYVNVPKNVVLTSGEADTMRVTVSDKGIILATYLYGQSMQPVSVDFKSFTHTGDQGSIPNSELKKLAMQRLMASSKITSVKPDRMVFYYNYGEKKRVPVQHSGQVQPDNQYYMASVDYMPDSVTIYASKKKLDSIHVVNTVPLNYTGVNDTLTVHARLQKISGVKMVPEVIDIRFITDVLSEVGFDNIPVVGLNMPEGKVLRTFPAKVSVRFVTGVSQYRNMSASDFVVVADYNKIKDNPSPKCTIEIYSKPEGVSRTRLNVTQVEYLIEE